MTERFARMSPRDRLAWLRRQVVSTPDVRKVMTTCQRLYDRAGIGPEGSAGLILGQSGAGKSTAIAAFADRLAEQLMAKNPDSRWERPKIAETPIRPIWEFRPERGYRRPLVVVVINPVPRFGSLMRDTAFALGIKLKNKHDFGEMMFLVQQQIQLQGVQMIIFEEVNQLVDAPIDTYRAADVLKIMIKAPLQVICVGTMEAKRLIEDLVTVTTEDDEFELNQANEQLLRLRRKQVTLRPLTCSLNDFPPLDKNGKPIESLAFPKTTFREFCKSLDDREDPNTIVLPFDMPSNISDPQTALRLWRATEGKIGLMMDLLLDATQLAIEKHKKCLSLAVLAAAYRDMEECDDKDNWFRMDFAEVERRFALKRRLNKGDDEIIVPQPSFRKQHKPGRVKKVPA